MIAAYNAPPILRHQLLRAVCLIALMMLVACLGETPPNSVDEPPHLLLPDPAVLRIAGSGTMVPLANVLADAYNAAHADLPVVVEESLGSGGGARAAADGAIDLGMIARPMTDKERGRGLHEYPIGRDAVIIAANRSLAVNALTSDQLRQIYNGQLRVLGGSPVILLLRDQAESANLFLEQWVSGLTQAREAAYKTGRQRVLFHDDSMLGSLVSTTHALGVVSLGAVTATHVPLKPLTVDGHKPTIASLLNGTWPATRPLAFVGRPERLTRARDFLNFVSSADGARIMRDNGYRPKDL